MEALAKLIPLVLTLSLGGLVLTGGLNSRKGNLIYVLRQPKLLFKAVLAVLIIPPVAAVLLALWLPLDFAVEAGIVMMAISPVPPLVPGKEIGIGARRDYAYGLYLAMALLTPLSVPLAVAIVTHIFGRDDHASITDIGRTVMLGVLLPLAVGTAIQRSYPEFAERIWKPVYNLSMLLIVVAFIPILVKFWAPMMTLIGNGTLLFMALVTAIAMAGGHLLGGPELRGRATLAVASSVRHPGIAMSLSAAFFADHRVIAAVLLFMLVGMVMSVPYGIWIRRQEPPKPARA